ncbi:glycosyltransferase family 4 protein [Clostridium botulinum]|uniref:glycosyltransferase family 4 protein n=1 Tax=Clostridium botulinum TaxID=1491 RepID=UPI0002F67C8F|nr:glycosyltransferase family 1 protein [Clostridium botulinum]KLU75415.1 glycosyl transferase [Clostridium botulinum V891]KOA95815.1 glycosyl transferase [Clostridium botulinum]MCD3203318.1 glycosyltransferase family 4 protein [Clostridium botulinum C/D]MCD3223296.1 glycosyltransferase family 4 protein [Clostridium botulinum C/D]MCD3231253.1 glycosyltransferase family 4 protein [Clostridium botulinum C/D]
MKIGIDARAAKWYRGTGIGTYTYQLVNSLNKIDDLNQYLIFMPQSSTYDIKFKNNYKIKNITKDMKGEFWDEVNIPNILKNQDIDLYHVPQNGVGLPKDKTSPFVITLHDIIPYKMPETVGPTYLEIFKKEMPNIISRCDGILTVSNYSKQDIIDAFNYPEEKIFVTHLANEDIYFPRDKVKCKNFISKNYGINDDYILYVGGFSPRKNIIGLIEAFSKFKNNNLKLIIVGKQGKSYALYKNTAEKLHIPDKVIFPGFIPLEHMPIFYNACKLFVYPSLYEGFGLPPIEAMACGAPIITSNLTSLPEVVGNAGLLINPYNIDELHQAMDKVLQDHILRNSLVKKSLTRSSKFSWTKTAKDTLTAFQTIAGYKK